MDEGKGGQTRSLQERKRNSLGLWPGPGRRQLWKLSSQNNGLPAVPDSGGLGGPVRSVARAVTGNNQRIWGEMRRKRKNGISRARAIPGKVTGRDGGRERRSSSFSFFCLLVVKFGLLFMPTYSYACVVCHFSVDLERAP